MQDEIWLKHCNFGFFITDIYGQLPRLSVHIQIYHKIQKKGLRCHLEYLKQKEICDGVCQLIVQGLFLNRATK